MNILKNSVRETHGFDFRKYPWFYAIIYEFMEK